MNFREWWKIKITAGDELRYRSDTRSEYSQFTAWLFHDEVPTLSFRKDWEAHQHSIEEGKLKGDNHLWNFEMVWSNTSMHKI